MAPYRFEERVDAQGRVHRSVRGKVGPFPARWEEEFGNGRKITALSRSETIRTARCGAGNGIASSLLKAKAAG